MDEKELKKWKIFWVLSIIGFPVLLLLYRLVKYLASFTSLNNIWGMFLSFLGLAVAMFLWMDAVVFIACPIEIWDKHIKEFNRLKKYAKENEEKKHN